MNTNHVNTYMINHTVWVAYNPKTKMFATMGENPETSDFLDAELFNTREETRNHIGLYSHSLKGFTPIKIQVETKYSVPENKTEQIKQKEENKTKRETELYCHKNGLFKRWSWIKPLPFCIEVTWSETPMPVPIIKCLLIDGSRIDSSWTYTQIIDCVKQGKWCHISPSEFSNLSRNALRE